MQSLRMELSLKQLLHVRETGRATCSPLVQLFKRTYTGARKDIAVIEMIAMMVMIMNSDDTAR
jgi:hypothetical protein